MLKPSADGVIILPDVRGERQTPGGLILPENLWEEHVIGTVVAVGPGPTGVHGTCPMTSSIGDHVIYPPSLGRTIPVPQPDGTVKEYSVMRQHEIAITIGSDAPAPAPEAAPKKRTRGKTK